ncbi:LCP family protein [Saccharopolyspora thermophila]|uniref:LCP family protein n=1 Tax=Saccharopolyspora thermophila TaxID=89367 RepID=UPI001E3D55E5|nr:LCP family protein [Saccharopolyspora subtropica]
MGGNPPGGRRSGRAGSAPPPGGPGRKAAQGDARRRPATRKGQEELPPEDDIWERRPKRRGARYAGRTLFALLSVLVLSTTGFGWAMFRPGAGSTSTADVIRRGLSAPDGATDILLIGNDSRTDAFGNPLPDEVLRELRTSYDGGDLTDAIILMRIPNGGQSASAMSFPRDTLVDIGLGEGKTKLTETLNRGKQAEIAKLRRQGITDEKELAQKGGQAGRALLRQTIENLTGVTIDHYAEVNLLGFYEITKAVGGVEVCLKKDTKDSYSGANFRKGVQTIQGGDALAFVRQRHGLINELDRGKRQQAFLSALARKILSTGTLANPAKLTALVNAIQKSITLDPALANDILGFAQQMQGIAGGNVQFYTAPVHLVGKSGEEDVTINIAETRQFTADLLLSPQERQRKIAARQARASITVSVFNASGVRGLAARVLDEVSAQGFKAGGGSNAEARNGSVIYFAPGEDAIAAQLADLLGGLPTEARSSVHPGSVQVYLGKDYKGPGAQNFAGPRTVRLDGPRQAAAPLHTQQEDAAEQPITAGGIVCVN